MENIITNENEKQVEFVQMLVPAPMLRGKRKEDFFALKITGEAMFPEYKPGDLVLFSKEYDIDYSGEVVLIEVDNHTMLCCIKKHNENDYELSTLNPYYPNKICTPEERADHNFKILGIPVMLYRNFEEYTEDEGGAEQ